MASTSRGHLLLDECEIDLLIDEFDAFRREYITSTVATPSRFRVQRFVALVEQPVQIPPGATVP